MLAPLLSREAVAKDYDKIFKLFAEEDPRDLLALFAGIPPEAPVEVKPLPREIMLPSLQVERGFVRRSTSMRRGRCRTWFRGTGSRWTAISRCSRSRAFQRQR
jgi:hypothetical protein